MLASSIEEEDGSYVVYAKGMLFLTLMTLPSCFDFLSLEDIDELSWRILV
jgi:hypothetical protein